jgi:hypothetical protein
VSRIVAVLVALGLILGAVVVRNAIDDGGGDGSSDGPTSGVVRVVCSTEVYAACASLSPTRYEVRSEDAPQTAAALVAGGDPGFDVWIAPRSWPGVVDDARSRAGSTALFADDASPVARSPLVTVGGDTGDSCDWKCVGAGSFSMGAAAPTSGLGTIELGAAAVGWFGRPDFATNDFDAAFRSWLASFTARITTNDRPVTTLLQSRAFFDVALSFEAEARTALDEASPDRKAGLSLQYPAPMAYLDVVAVDVDPNRARVAAGVARTVGSLLFARGWQEPASTSDGLPKPGVLTALRDLL